jgi:hypothetical protein
VNTLRIASPSIHRIASDTITPTAPHQNHARVSRTEKGTRYNFI